MEEEANVFYVVRKGDIVGVYRSLRDCQAQVSSSACDPSVRVYKGYSLGKEEEDYLASHGLKNASHAIRAMDVKEDTFGTLVPCPFSQPDGLAFLDDKSSNRMSTEQMSKGVNKTQHDGFAFLDGKSHQAMPTQQRPKGVIQQASCILEFDGASKGNPGKAGAAAILRTEDGSVVCRVRQGLGVTTNNVAEYRALILGMQCALKKGFKHIRARGDSQLVAMQVQGLWQTKNQNMADLCKVVKELKQMFAFFQITHVRREFNSDADAEANRAINLPAGEIYED